MNASTCVSCSIATTPSVVSTPTPTMTNSAPNTRRRFVANTLPSTRNGHAGIEPSAPAPPVCRRTSAASRSARNAVRCSSGTGVVAPHAGHVAAASSTSASAIPQPLQRTGSSVAAAGTSDMTRVIALSPAILARRA